MWDDECSSGLSIELDGDHDKVVINKNDKGIVGLSKVTDYVYRPMMYSDICLYDWVRLSNKGVKSRTRKRDIGKAADDSDAVETDHELNIIPGDSGDIECRAKINSEYNRFANEIESEIYDIDESDILESDTDESEMDELDVMLEKEDKSVPVKDYSFLPIHPQAKTHQIHMKKDNDLIVPNFLPSTLPRSDRGDREYYCSTMLTLFKPWRSGFDLKNKLETWDKSFTSHEFAKRHLDVMKYFNVRYECLDARDDYSAKRAREDEGGIKYHWASSDILDHLDETHHAAQVAEDYVDTSNCNDVEDDEAFKLIGQMAKSRMAAMTAAERTMRMSGWLDECLDGLPDVGPLEPVEPTIKQSGKLWRNSVLLKRQEIMEDRLKNLPAKPLQSFATHTFKPNDVKIVDKNYIDRLFKPSTQIDDDLISTTIAEFMLNSDQERAFHIIANHATLENPQKLHMYLGGMGGTGKSQVIKALIQFFKKRKEEHRFVVLAPTGAAAALLNGSTYHSVLGIDDRSSASVSAKAIAQVRARLDGVDYIFLDEVSMLSCRDLYKISAQCAKARGERNEPFGGINFIFAGDFAQLPPPRSGASLYSVCWYSTRIWPEHTWPRSSDW